MQAKLAPTEEEARAVADATYSQKRYLVECGQVKYLHATALKMGEALLVSESSAPEFPATPFLWLHPLAALLYRGERVRALFVYRPYDLSVFDQNPYLARWRSETRQWCREFFLPFSDRREVVIVSEAPVEQGSESVRVTMHPFAAYTTSWEGIAACPSGSCTFESLGEEEVRIPCQTCRDELEYWSRWLKTMLWVIAGRFRRPHERGSAGSEEIHREEMTIEMGTSEQRVAVAGEIVRYDASYFRSVPRHEGRPLSVSHRIITAEEVGGLEEEEVDLRHVLIKDFTDVEDFTRTLRAKRYYPEGQVPANPEFLRRVTVKGRKAKRQLISLVTWKFREERRAELRRKQTLLRASAFKERGEG